MQFRAATRALAVWRVMKERGDRKRVVTRRFFAGFQAGKHRSSGAEYSKCRGGTRAKRNRSGMKFRAATRALAVWRALKERGDRKRVVTRRFSPVFGPENIDRAALNIRSAAVGRAKRNRSGRVVSRCDARIGCLARPERARRLGSALRRFFTGFQAGKHRPSGAEYSKRRGGMRAKRNRSGRVVLCYRCRPYAPLSARSVSGQ